MSGSSANLITAKGLITFSNELSVPEGALVKANNVNIDERGVITPRRGFADYGTSISTEDTRLNQIMEYKDRLIRHYGSILEFDNGSGTFTSFSGTYTEIEDGFRLKYQEAQGNLYFTSDSGIKKISETSAANITASSIEDSGAVKAYDIEGTGVINATGFLTTESKVAYRVVFGKKDNNGNLLLGSPSARFVVTNSSAVDNNVVDLEITLVSELTTEYFYQVYRTGVVQISGSLTLNDIDPGDEMNLVIENPITSSDLSAGTITIQDITPEDFRESGALLYTNEITGEGILQSNEPPPIAKDIELFRNTMFYANTKTIHQLSINMISISNITAGTTKIFIGNSTSTRTYSFENAENVANQEIGLSSSPSIGVSIDETARSMVKVINRDPSGIVYARYLSGPNDLPGIIQLESRNLTDDNFYIGINDSSASGDFNPQLPVSKTINSISFSAGSGSPALINSTAHGFTTGDSVFVYSPDTTPAFSGLYTATVSNVNEFTVPVNITGEDLAGTNAILFQPTGETSSDNLEFSNRLYFSKTGQADAVPSVNYLSIGPEDEPIERIIALRDNLFVLKTDGVYIVDGVTSPNFSSRLLDNSTNIIAPDSGVVLNNQIYCLTTQGIATVTETGVSILSRPIENLILGITNSRYNFRLPSFGVSYESDRSYILWLPTETDDTIATQCYRYNTFERAWTRWDVQATCGLVNSATDKLYLGAGDRNYILEERKLDSRTDHSDRNITKSLGTSAISETLVELNSLVDVSIGDVLVQEQYITLTIYNRLLKKLDIDPGLDDTDYENTLLMSPGDNITDKMNSLNTKIDADDSSGQVTAKVFSTDWATLRTQFNTLIDELNNASCDTIFKSYKKEEDNTYIYEAIITAINVNTNVVTVAYATNFIEGSIELYKGINTEIQWSPQHFGQPSLLKQVSEGVVIFDQNNFYSAQISFSSDVSAGFAEVDFLGKGVGYWGSSTWGSINPAYYWGGEGNDIPFRTIIPRLKQRCRYINFNFKHINAREAFRILGIAAKVRAISTKAYR